MYTVFATKDPSLRGKGVACFLVPRDAPGISIGKHEDKMGYRTCATNDVVFEDCRIPLKNMVGGEGQGMEIADAGIVDLRLASAAKVMASDLSMQVCTDAVQVLGGYGYSREYPVEKRFRDAKIYQIFEGTNQIQRMVIASDLLHS